jgi:hypothetical protein
MSLHIFRVTFDNGESVTGSGKNLVHAILSAVAVRNAQAFAIATDEGKADQFRPINADHVTSCERLKRFTRAAA